MPGAGPGTPDRGHPQPDRPPLHGPDQSPGPCAWHRAALVPMAAASQAPRPCTPPPAASRPRTIRITIDGWSI